MIILIQIISSIMIPVMILGICLFGYLRGIRVYEAFVEGAKEGLMAAARIAPYLIAMFVAIGMFRSSGALPFIAKLLAPIVSLLGMPPELLPLMIIRPLSATGSLGALVDIFKTHGPDSPIGMMASMIQSSCETTFYVVTIYFGAVGIKKVRHTLALGIMADILAIIGSVLIYNHLRAW